MRGRTQIKNLSNTIVGVTVSPVPNSGFLFYMTKSFVLAFVKNGKAISVFEHQTVQQVQIKRKELSKDPLYFGGKLQVRTYAGFKAKPIL